MTVFFTADTHFGHKTQAWRRGFGTQEAPETDAHDDAMVKNWNSVVKPGDTVYHLGDFSFLKPGDTADLIYRLNGWIQLVPGNHDDDKTLRRITDMQHMSKIKILPELYEAKFSQGQPDGTNIVERLVLCHFPMLTWNRSHYGVGHLHGHSHGSCRYSYPEAKILDVGVDCHDLKPISLEQVQAIFKDRQGHTADHHRVQTLQ